MILFAMLSACATDVKHGHVDENTTATKAIDLYRSYILWHSDAVICQLSCVPHDPFNGIVMQIALSPVHFLITRLCMQYNFCKGSSCQPLQL